MKKINEKGYISFKQAFIDFWTGIVDFEGKTTRSGYWWGVLTGVVTQLLLILILAVIMIALPDTNTAYIISIVLAVIIMLLTLIVLLPLITLQIRRLHDIGLNYKAIIVFYSLLIILHFILTDFSLHIHIIKLIIYSLIALMQLILFVSMFLNSNTLKNIRYIGGEKHEN